MADEVIIAVMAAIIWAQAGGARTNGNSPTDAIKCAKEILSEVKGEAHGRK